jgi:hypothetical protein
MEAALCHAVPARLITLAVFVAQLRRYAAHAEGYRSEADGHGFLPRNSDGVIHPVDVLREDHEANGDRGRVQQASYVRRSVLARWSSAGWRAQMATRARCRPNSRARINPSPRERANEHSVPVSAQDSAEEAPGAGRSENRPSASGRHFIGRVAERAGRLECASCQPGVMRRSLATSR